MTKQEQMQQAPQPDDSTATGLDAPPVVPPVQVPLSVAEEKKSVSLPKGSKISVDRKLFFKLAQTMILLNPNQSLAHGARRQIGQMLGAKNYQEECDFWDLIKAEIVEMQKAQEAQP